MEGVHGGAPSPCFREARAGLYAKKHNPFLYYDDTAIDPARCARVVPLTQLASDLQAGALPTFSWISPNLCHDAHSCGVGEGDEFLARLVPPLLDAIGPQGLLVVTWDEGTSSRGCCNGSVGGNVATILAGGAALPGARTSVPYDHYSLLRLIEKSWGLPGLGASRAAPVPTELLASARV